ncbi:hypothetical protein TIFTF001_026365 [Ficus carica]|uniref:Uncharacterized protein n=1 Tax=Ficus carica TaxID=3494 RepID=A0AA88DL14_FICCA|nr:hypothetical protein TIFTF001_026365 [Ficus carica]
MPAVGAGGLGVPGPGGGRQGAGWGVAGGESLALGWSPKWVVDGGREEKREKGEERRGGGGGGGAPAGVGAGGGGARGGSSRERGEERENGVTDDRPAGTGDESPASGVDRRCPSLATGRSPTTEKTFGGKDNMRSTKRKENREFNQLSHAKHKSAVQFTEISSISFNIATHAIDGYVVLNPRDVPKVL